MDASIVGDLKGIEKLLDGKEVDHSVRDEVSLSILVANDYFVSQLKHDFLLTYDQ